MNSIIERIKKKKLILKAVKIALGSSAAIYIALLFHLDYEISAGTIALLTIVTTKWATVKLSFARVTTMFLTILLAWTIFWHLDNEWIAFGIFVFLLVIISEMLGWGATISVNAVIGAHFLTRLEFTWQFIRNEIMLVIIGITIAIIVNLFHNNGKSRKELVEHMRHVEMQLQSILGEVAVYLSRETMQRNVWDDICGLEEQIKQYVIDACEYQDNTFSSHPGYYIDYFEMRMQQCMILHNLHYEMKKIRNMPKQAQIIAEYILYMKDYVVETNSPVKQINRLQNIFEDMQKEPLPVSRTEFESRAVLYHILMDLEDFLIAKKRFVENLSEVRKNIYWRKI